MLSFGFCSSNTTPTLSEIQIKLLFCPKQYMVETICSQDKMHISLTSFRFYEMWGISWLDENRLASQEGLCSMEQVNKYFTQKENKKNVLDFLIQSTPLLQLSTYLLTYLLHAAESFLRGLYAPVITTICFISLLINRYNDRLLPLLRQFFLIPNRINKFSKLFYPLL